MTIKYGIVATPFGHTLIAVSDGAVCELSFIGKQSDAVARKRVARLWPDALLIQDERTARAFAEKIFKKKQSVDVLLKGTDFQLAVWKQLAKIPKGKTLSYAEVAKKVGRPKAVRAVGTACGKNPVAYVVPCHRVLAKDGSLGGFGFGLPLKQTLLRGEGVAL